MENINGKLAEVERQLQAALEKIDKIKKEITKLLKKI